MDSVEAHDFTLFEMMRELDADTGATGPMDESVDSIAASRDSIEGPRNPRIFSAESRPLPRSLISSNHGRSDPIRARQHNLKESIWTSHVAH